MDGVITMVVKRMDVICVEESSDLCHLTADKLYGVARNAYLAEINRAIEVTYSPVVCILLFLVE